ncbi:hypothetical protein CCC_00195 [Paramagnetospirillum magnetotacticum MS-1]|uniref:Uncharacterized protein n=1 Tax=Paramagnetospirillum magnetotacticum MS-1 TaxID=272627 RepID=A0A0C2YBP3_PARME|nr:hypothetical protein [Paramagnetospirillum magnetotacticum]KIL97134.1 hypothetical protein CCC_00195 [Paramagnetospirillum magnetotacticum MS-1]
MMDTVPLAVLGRGFWKLNLIVSPLSLLLVLYLGVMSGGGPNSTGALDSLLIAGAFIFLTPAGLVAAHILGAKIVDAVLRIVPLARAEVSWIGLAASGILVVVAGNVLVDDLYQFRHGNYGISIIALCLDLGGVAAVVLTGGGKLPGLRGKSEGG